MRAVAERACDSLRIIFVGDVNDEDYVGAEQIAFDSLPIIGCDRAAAIVRGQSHLKRAPAIDLAFGLFERR
jgi:hypothetical protein